MPSLWKEVKIHDQRYDTNVSAWGTGYIQIGTGHKIYRVKSITPVTLDQCLAADDGTTHVAAPGEAFSTTQPACLLSSTRGKMIAPCHYEIDAVFTDPTGFTSPTDLLALPAKITSTGLNGTEEYAKDYDTTPKYVLNTAFAPFNSLPRRLSAGCVFTISKWVTSSTKAIIAAAEHTNNLSAVSIQGFVLPTDSGLIQNATFDTSVTLSGIVIYQAVMTIEFNPELWFDPVLNVGFSEWNSTAHKWNPIMQTDPVTNRQTPITRPCALNMDGTKYADPSAAPIVLKFWPYPQMSWGGVPLA